MRIMWFSFLYDKTQPLDLAPVFRSGSHDIDSGGVDGTVTQNVGKLCNVLFDAVKGAGKEFSQIVGKHLGWLYPCGFTQLFHGRPDVAPV